jgi:hypothetical protein
MSGNIIGFQNVPEYLPSEQEHRRQIARRVNSLGQAKVNAYIDVTITKNAVTTTLTDARIGYYSAIIPAMPTTATGAGALGRGIWITNIVSGSCTINHSVSPDTDMTIRFLIIG